MYIYFMPYNIVFNLFRTFVLEQERSLLKFMYFKNVKILFPKYSKNGKKQKLKTAKTYHCFKISFQTVYPCVTDLVGPLPLWKNLQKKSSPAKEIP